MKTKLAIYLITATSAYANLIDLTPGGFTIDPNGGNIPLAYTRALSQLHFDTSLSPIFGRGPWLIDGQYLSSNLFDTSPTSAADIGWNLIGQPDGNWLTYVVLFGQTASGEGIYNVYGVSGLRFRDDLEHVTIDEISVINGIAFYGLNPNTNVAETGLTFTLFVLGLVSLFGATSLKGKHT